MTLFPLLEHHEDFIIVWNNSMFSGQLIHIERFAMVVKFSSLHLKKIVVPQIFMVCVVATKDNSSLTDLKT
jgi:hypothetical protein